MEITKTLQKGKRKCAENQYTLYNNKLIYEFFYYLREKGQLHSILLKSVS